MPAQHCLTIDGTQVLWKHYRQKQGSEDILKFCFGKALPEKQWKTHRISHAVVNACSTNAALASAVRQVAAEILGVELRPSKVVECGCIGHPPAPQPPAPTPSKSSAPTSDHTTHASDVSVECACIGQNVSCVAIRIQMNFNKVFVLVLVKINDHACNLVL